MRSIPSSRRNRCKKAVRHAQPTQPKEILSSSSTHFNFYSFLSVAQQHDVEFMPITWEPGRDLLGLGASGHVNQSLLSLETSLAFKRPANSGRDEKARQQLFREWVSEISILRFPEIQRHPNIIELEGIAWEVVESGSTVLPVLVYRKSQLGTLRTFIEANAGRLSLDQKLSLCLDLASGLLILHSCNVVHGDIKPGNSVVFSNSLGSHDVTAKMIDFGYSCYGMEDEDTVQITGTPLWCAPENNGDEVTILAAKRMDVYSFALVCCWILFFDTVTLDSGIEVQMEGLSMGDKPRKKMYRFIEQIRDADGPEELISKVISQTPSLRGQKSSLLQALLTRTLCKSPSDRPYDWSQFILVLSEVRGSEIPVLPTIDQAQTRIKFESCEFHVLDSLADFDIADFRVRKFIVNSLEQTMNCSLCEKCSVNAAFERALCQRIGFGEPKNDDFSDASLIKSGRLPEHLSRELARFRNIPHEGLSLRMQHLVGGYSLDLPYIYQVHSCLGLAELEYEREIEDRQLVVPVDHPSLLRLRYALGHVYEALERWERAESLYKMVLEARRRIFGANAATTLICEAKVGSCFVMQGQLVRGEQTLRGTLLKLESSKGEDNKNTIAAMGHLGSSLTKQGRFEDANEILKRQLKLSKRVSGETHVDTLSILLNLALNSFSTGNWAEAETLIFQVIQLQKDLLGFDDREVLTGMHSLCRVYIEQGRYEDAQKLQVQEMKIYKKSSNINGLGALLSMVNLGLVLVGQHKLDEAVKVQYHAATALESLMGEDYPDTLSAWSDLARSYRLQTRLSEAQKIQERVVSLTESAPELSQRYAPGFLAGLADIYSTSGRWNDAEDAYLKALKLAGAIFGSKHPWTLYTRASLASLYKRKGRLDDAKDIEEAVLELMKEELSPTHEKTLTVMRNLSITYRFLGKLDEALKLQKEIDKLRPKYSSETDLLEDKLNTSNILCGQKDYNAARVLQEEVVSNLEKLKGSEDSETLNSRFHLAQTYVALQLLPEAERIHEEDLPRYVSLYSEAHDLTLLSRSELARVWTRQNRWQMAEHQYEDIFRTYTTMGLRNHRSALKARIGIAYAKSGQGQSKESIMILKELIREAEEQGLQIDQNIAEEIQIVLMVALMAQADPELLSELEMAGKEMPNSSTDAAEGADEQP